MRAFLVTLCAAALLTACNPVANLNQGEEQIAQFHDRYARGEYAAIYRAAGPQLRESATPDQFYDLLKVVAARLGDIQETERVGFNVNTNNGVTLTNVVMASTFELGNAQETFTFTGNGDNMKLVGWHINSDRLVFTPDDLTQDQTTADPVAN